MTNPSVITRDSSHLFEPIQLRSIQARNRIVIAPMQQYSAQADGLANDWHLLHLGRFALGGAGVVFVESTAVEARGRNTYGDIGLWSDAHIEPLARIAQALTKNGAVAAIQLGHTGRKAAHRTAWQGMGPLTQDDADQGQVPWQPVAPSAIPGGPGWQTPHALTETEIFELLSCWGLAAGRAALAGFKMLEIHGAHGYLIHQFLSPRSNHRQDAWGGSTHHRQRLALEVAKAVRSHWPAHLPLAWRLSMTDLDDGTLPLDDMVGFIKRLREVGVDIVDCSSGGGIDAHPTVGARIPRGLAFRASDARELRARTGVAIMGVGFVIRPEVAQSHLREACADLIAIGREALFNPNWPLHAQHALAPDSDYGLWPMQHRWHLSKRGSMADDERRLPAPLLSGVNVD